MYKAFTPILKRGLINNLGALIQVPRKLEQLSGKYCRDYNSSLLSCEYFRILFNDLFGNLLVSIAFMRLIRSSTK